jgi:hypothetical protein
MPGTEDQANVTPPLRSEAIVDALRGVKEMLGADGFGLEASVAQERVELRVVPVSADCSDCLVPRQVMEQVVTDALAKAGFAVPFTLHYPAPRLDV